MKTQNEFVKGLLLFVYGILNMIPGVSHFVPSIKKAADNLQANKPTKVWGYMPIVIAGLIVLLSYNGGISKDDKELIQITLDSAKAPKIDSLKVDSIKIDSLAK